MFGVNKALYELRVVKPGIPEPPLLPELRTRSTWSAVRDDFKFDEFGPLYGHDLGSRNRRGRFRKSALLIIAPS